MGHGPSGFSPFWASCRKLVSVNKDNFIHEIVAKTLVLEAKTHVTYFAQL